MSVFLLLLTLRLQVDEGIEAMLCCWLQQLQEFGGPEVEKPDLLKGSIGSLKNLGLPVPTKPNSGSETLIRHSAAAIDHKARYNVSILGEGGRCEAPSGQTTNTNTNTLVFHVAPHLVSSAG